MTTCVLVRAFVNADGEHGNPALVVVEPDDSGKSVTPGVRQELATRLGFPATVFVHDEKGGVVSIHGNYGPIRFGGHPLLATTEVLWRRGTPVTYLVPEAGAVACRRDEDGMVWLTAPAAWSKPWRHYECAMPAEIDAMTGLPEGEDFTQVWSWLDRSAGRVRARLWAPRIGKGEDEACGSASMLLTLMLGRALEVVHGRHGAIIRTRPVDATRVELGGRCVVDVLPAGVQARVDEIYA